MKIGITERGDAGIHCDEWFDKLGSVDAAVLISKDITGRLFQNLLLWAYQCDDRKIILHCGCTGWGGTKIEPGVPGYKEQIDALCQVISAGFPKEQCVLRIDPVFPTEKGLARVEAVLAYAKASGLLPGLRVRISILDEYPHVRKRFEDLGFSPVYGGAFTAPKPLLMEAGRFFEAMGEKYGIVFETCAERKAYHPYGLRKRQGP